MELNQTSRFPAPPGDWDGRYLGLKASVGRLVGDLVGIRDGDVNDSLCNA